MMMNYFDWAIGILIVLDYLIFYKIEGTTIFVYRILHGARNYKSLL